MRINPLSVISILYLACFCSSCATLLNSRKERVDIFTPVPATAIVGQDTFQYDKEKIRLEVARSARPLQVQLLSGAHSNEFQIASRNSFAFWSNLYANYGLGMLIDYDSPKRYSYPGKIYLNPLDPTGTYQLWRPPVRNQELAVKIFIPYLNIFHLRPDKEPDIKSNSGFWGLGLGLDYYHQPDQFLALSASVQTNFYVPVPAAVDFEGEYEFISSHHISFTNNHRAGRFTLGYGLSFSHNKWEFRSASFGSPLPPTRSPARRLNNAVGLAFPIHYYTGKSFYCNFVYRPSFWRASDSRPFGYEHLVSFGFGWDIRLR